MDPDPAGHGSRSRTHLEQEGMLGLDLDLDMELNQLDPRLEDRKLGRAMESERMDMDLYLPLG